MVTAIAMVDQQWAIANKEGQPIRLKADLMRFRDMTMNHPVILGMNTLSHIPSGKPLTDRKHYVITHHTDITPVSDIVTFVTLDQMIEILPTLESPYVIGGESIYTQLLPYCDTVEITTVSTMFQNPTKFFPHMELLWSFVVDSEYDENDYQLDVDIITGEHYITHYKTWRRFRKA